MTDFIDSPLKLSVKFESKVFLLDCRTLTLFSVLAEPPAPQLEHTCLDGFVFLDLLRPEEL
jgi:hypothetical protein